MLLQEKDRIILDRKTPDTAEVVEQFVQESMRRSQRTSLVHTPDLSLMSQRNDSADVRDGRLAEKRQRHNDSSLDDYDHVHNPPQVKPLFSSRFEEFLTKYKQKKVTESPTKQMKEEGEVGGDGEKTHLEESLEDDEIRVPLGELQRDILRLLQGWEASEANGKRHELEVRKLQGELAARSRGETAWREKYEILDIQTKMLLSKRPGSESFMSMRRTAENLGGMGRMDTS